MSETTALLSTEELEAQEEELAPVSGDFPWVLFSVGDVVYAIFSKHVLSIEILNATTPLVDSPIYARGITNFRGDMISLIDLRMLFGLPPNVLDGDSREMIVVLEVDGVVKGIIVDEIVSVEYVDRMLEMPGLTEMTQYIRNLGKREKDNSTIQIIDEEKIISL
ncbi:MAG: chemotaxis protein CheW [Oscillospiraceae bacterium]|nr:chemotaxis protein CheW [Oscillospiraceae bacterium]